VRRGGVPPTVRVAGVAPIAKADWVIVSREPAEQDFWIWRHRRRVRAIYTVSIVEAAFPNLVKITPAKRTRDRQGDPVPRFYTVKRSDRHLRGIAQRVLGDGDRWREIARKNKIRDGKNIKAGQRLRLP
jgi:nucleoid-associated protein YgaU